MNQHTSNRQRSNRAQKHAAMLKKALTRPEVREVMQVYQNHQKIDKGLDLYRQATKRLEIVITTDLANKERIS